MSPQARSHGMGFALCVIALLALPQAVWAQSSDAVMRNYEVRLVGTVRSVDARSLLVTIAYAPLETAPGGVRPLRVAAREALLGLRAGDAVSGIADTRHSPWTLRDMHVLR